MAVAARIGVMDQFDSAIESRESYYERFEQCVAVNKLTEDTVPCLLSVSLTSLSGHP